jgi:ubiquinone/menaquinone biosynthesis C-methylase UbiE
MGLPATWDLLAAGYANDVEPHFRVFSEQALALAPFDSGARVLDVAAGPGTLTFLAAARGAYVSAVDFSLGMVEQLRQRVRRDSIKGVDAEVMDAQSLTFHDGTFHAAFFMFGAMFIPDRGRAFRELRRVLRPESRAVVATWAPIDRRPIMQVGFAVMAEVFPDLPPPLKGDLQDHESCIRELSDAGFRDVTAQSFTGAMRVDSPEHYLAFMERSGPMAMLRQRMGEDTWRATAPRLLESIAKHIPAGGADLSAEAILTVGTR